MLTGESNKIDADFVPELLSSTEDILRVLAISDSL